MFSFLLVAKLYALQPATDYIAAVNRLLGHRRCRVNILEQYGNSPVPLLTGSDTRVYVHGVAPSAYRTAAEESMCAQGSGGSFKWVYSPISFLSY
jgi:hypothetical protein